MSEVKVDTISERTTDGGVTIDGVLVKDGTATFQTAAGSPLVFEGATADDYETTFAITDPTADRTITFPDSSFTVPTSGGLTYKSQWRLTTDFADSVDPLKLYWTAVEADDPRSTDTTPDSNTALGAPMDLDTSTGYWTFPTTGWWHVEFVCTYLPANYSNTPSGGFIKYATDGATFETVAKENGSTESGYSQLSVVSVFLKIENTSEDQFSLGFYSAGSNTCRGDADSNYTFITCTKVGDI